MLNCKVTVICLPNSNFPDRTNVACVDFSIFSSTRNQPRNKKQILSGCLPIFCDNYKGFFAIVWALLRFLLQILRYFKKKI